MTEGLTSDKFIKFFRDRHGWECQPGTHIYQDLTNFAKEREGSTRDMDELYTVFCLAHGLQPYPRGKYEN